MLTPEMRETNIGSLGLVLATWVLTDEIVAKYPVANTFASLLRTTLSGMYFEDESGEVVLRQVFFKADYAPQRWKGVGPEALSLELLAMGYARHRAMIYDTRRS